MSKMDGLRAMREARYAAARAAAPAKKTERAPVAPAEAPAKKRAPAKAKAEAATPDTGELCGHRNMGGKTCTREQGHAAKSHRYS